MDIVQFQKLFGLWRYGRLDQEQFNSFVHEYNQMISGIIHSWAESDVKEFLFFLRDSVNNSKEPYKSVINDRFLIPLKNELGILLVFPIDHQSLLDTYRRQSLITDRILSEAEKMIHGLSIVRVDFPDGTHQEIRTLKEFQRYIQTLEASIPKAPSKPENDK